MLILDWTMPFKIIQGANKLALISFKSFEEFVELIFCFYPDANNRPLPDFFFSLGQSGGVLLLPLLLYSESCSILFTSNIRPHIRWRQCNPGRIRRYTRVYKRVHTNLPKLTSPLRFSCSQMACQSRTILNSLIIGGHMRPHMCLGLVTSL